MKYLKLAGWLILYLLVYLLSTLLAWMYSSLTISCAHFCPAASSCPLSSLWPGT